MQDSNKKLIYWSLAILAFFVFAATVYYLFVFKASLRGVPPDVSGRTTKQSLDEFREEPQIFRHSDSDKESFQKYTGSPAEVIKEDKSVSGIYPDSYRTKMKNRVLEIAGELVVNPDKFDLWLELGTIKKNFGDYLGARDAWEYAGLIRPKNDVCFYNLGNLYALYLRDYSKAELNYTKAIKNAPSNIFAYIALADLYQDSYKEKSGQVVKVIEGGLASNPSDQTLLSYLARYYKEKGDYAKALEYYEKVLKLDPDNQAVKAEIEMLK